MGVVTALAVILAPSSLLAPIAPARWEEELIRFMALVALGVWLLWPWAMGQGGGIALRMRLLVGSAMVAFAIHLAWARSLFLLLAFVLLFAAAVNIGLERADVAARSLHRRLGIDRRRK